MKTTWTTFLKQHGGKGHTREELSEMYKKQKRSPKKDCQLQVQTKIRKNMDEFKEGRYSTRQQAIAVAIQQVLRLSPKCKPFYKK